MLSYAELDRVFNVNNPILISMRNYTGSPGHSVTAEQLASFVAHACHTVGFDIDRYTNGVSNLVLLFEAFDQQRQRVVPAETASISCLTRKQNWA